MKGTDLQSVMNAPRKLLILLVMTTVAVSACDGLGGVEVVQAPTATLLPVNSEIPNPMASPVLTQSPFPTFTATPSYTPLPPSATYTPLPTATPTVSGVIQSQQRVNIRSGPGVDYEMFQSLAPGEAVQVIGQNVDGTWYNIRMDDGEEGWIASSLLFIADTPTPIPTATNLPDLTALYLGTLTPTIQGAVPTATPVGGAASSSTAETNGLQVNVPIVNLDMINMTATALVANAASATPTRDATSIAETDVLAPTSLANNTNMTATALALLLDDSLVQSVEQTATALVGDVESPLSGVEQTATALAIPAGVSSTPIATEDSVLVPTLAPDALMGVDVFAFCNNRAYGIPAPETLPAGSTIEIYWAWFATTDDYLDQHVTNAVHELKVNGVQISNVNQFRQNYTMQGSNHAVYWYVPFGPLDAGEYLITYRVTWQRAITDGSRYFGPGTAVEFEEESCNFTVQ